VAAKVVEVQGGKKLALALQSIEAKITRGGVLRVGFLEDAKYPAARVPRGTKQPPALPVAQVAFWNEFGTKRAPARPFFRTTVARESKKWGEQLGKAIVFYQYDGEKALRALGQSMRDDIEASIQRWTSPPNAEYTIRRKGFDKPLVHTGTMSRAPDFEIAKT
jgi:hypothetical protein